MFIIIKDGRQHGYRYVCPKCTSVYVATHDEEKRYSSGTIYTTCPICGEASVTAQTTKEVDCSEIVKPH